MNTSTAHSKLVSLLASEPSSIWGTVHGRHQTANIALGDLSVEVEVDVALQDSRAIVDQVFIDNRNTSLSVRVHTGYHLGPTDPATTMLIADAVVRCLRENTDLSDGYTIFDVDGAAFNIALESSATTGAEIKVNIHKVESYDQQ